MRPPADGRLGQCWTNTRLPEIVQDLEIFPWPWPDNSADEILLCHVLEHLGQTPDLFLKIMQELYRVCKPNATVTIMVPDPRHDFFLNDPTHVRPHHAPVTTRDMFSKKQCEAWSARKQIQHAARRLSRRRGFRNGGHEENSRHPASKAKTTPKFPKPTGARTM